MSFVGCSRRLERMGWGWWTGGRGRLNRSQVSFPQVRPYGLDIKAFITFRGSPRITKDSQVTVLASTNCTTATSQPVAKLQSHNCPSPHQRQSVPYLSRQSTSAMTLARAQKAPSWTSRLHIIQLLLRLLRSLLADAGVADGTARVASHVDVSLSSILSPVAWGPL